METTGILSNLNLLRERVKRGKASGWNEENTKSGIINLVLQELGYDTTDPDEVTYEVNADVPGLVKNERVDVAIYTSENGDKRLRVLLEAKAVTVTLDSSKHMSQLYRYYTALQPEVAILTNGDDWWFYTDYNKQNIMDEEPFLKLSLTSSLSSELNNFVLYSKGAIDTLDTHKEVKYSYMNSVCLQVVDNLKQGTFPDYMLTGMLEHTGLSGAGVTVEELNEYLSLHFKLHILDKLIEPEQLKSMCCNIQEEDDEYTLTITDVIKNDLDIDLSSVRIFSNVTEVKSYRQLFFECINEIAVQRLDNRELLLERELWGKTIGVYSSMPDLCRYSSDVNYLPNSDLYVLVHADKQAILKKLKEVIYYLGIGEYPIGFKLKEIYYEE